MADLNTGASAVTRRRFELLLLAAALFETAHLVGLFQRRVEVDGTALAVLFTLGAPWVTFGLGLAITRLRSSAAKWILVVLVAIALFSSMRIGTARWDEPAIFLGAIAGLLQLAAVAMLFTREGRGWTGRSNAAARP